MSTACIVGVVSTYPVEVVRLPRLRMWRERRALTQQELANLAGITRVALVRIESGQAEPMAKTIRRLAKALNVQVEDLMGPLPDA